MKAAVKIFIIRSLSKFTTINIASTDEYDRIVTVKVNDIFC